MKQLFFAMVFYAALLATAEGAVAETYPSRPIRFIVPQTPGGTSDIVARMVAQKLAEAVKQPVVIDNRAGASGTIGTAIAAKAPADGYTIVLAYTVHTTSAALYAQLPYDPVRSFATVTILATAPLLLVVPPRVPATTVAEFIRVAKTAPRPLTFGSAGNGSGGHLAGELLKVMAQVPLAHIPYRGTGQAITELIGGQIDFMFAAIIPIQPHVKSGRLRGIAVSSTRRSVTAPEIPTVAESGLEGFEYIGWYGVLAPAGTPGAVIARLHAEFVKILQLPDLRERLLTDGAETMGNSPAEFAAFLKAEMERWARVIKQAGAKID
ncbi:MAG: tripartite tricarboxylate transporter substrate binding protein [Betaproteobacteria bacterium]|nr:tripartite tricarboxylate transporter substrate binding protein [Betaproteobacteria bacterium]MBI3057207.1 tripartite tricarboxylate transporter substrate binding protein [Betaproteobacteria bacterium]